MKKIVKSIDFEAITEIAYINDKSIVAIKWSESRCSIIVQAKDGLFYGANYKSLDLLQAWSRASKKEYVECALKQKGTEAFEFNSYKELYEWLAIQ
jgi:hypothetical protein